MSRCYFRIQPAGLTTAHLSETSSGELADGLHVFVYLHQVWAPDCMATGYGDEVLILSAERHWANGDVEGVCVDGASAVVVARYSLGEFLALTADFDDDLDADDVTRRLEKIARPGDARRESASAVSVKETLDDLRARIRNRWIGVGDWPKIK
jgi:hypothetical protein